MSDLDHDTNRLLDTDRHQDHRWHWVGCALMLVAGLYLLLGGSARGALGASVGLAFLLCPIVMGVVVWLLLRTAGPTRSAPRQGERT